MERKPAFNDEGIPHLYTSRGTGAEGGTTDEGEETKKHVRAMWSKNTDHRKNKVFNPDGTVPIAVSDTAHVASDSPALEGVKGKLRSAIAGNNQDSDSVPDETVRGYQGLVRRAQKARS